MWLLLPSVALSAERNVCSGCTYETLSDALTAANPDDTIILGDGTWDGDVTLDRSLTLRAENEGFATVTGSGADTLLLSCPDCTIQLTGIQVANTSSGRAIAVIDGTIANLDEIWVDSHTSAVAGGALEVRDDATVVANGLHVNSGLATSADGLIHAKGNSTLTLTNGLFDDNFTPDGVITILSAALLDGNTLSENLGQALRARPGSNVNVVNNVFDDNSALQGGHVHIEPDALYDSTANDLLGDPALIADQGGALYAGARSNVLIISDNFQGNNALYGGAIFAEGVDHLDIAGAVFDGNVATDDGGAIAALDTSDSDQHGWSDAVFRNNIAGEQGGAIYWEPDATAISTLRLFASDLLDNDAGISGGAVAVKGTGAQLLELTDLFFEDNLSSTGGAIFLEDADVTAVRTSFCRNRAGDGAAVVVDGATTNTWTNVLLLNNEATSTTNGAFVAFDDVTLHHATIAGNPGPGPAIEMVTGELTLTDSLIFANTSSGGVVDVASSATVEHSVFFDNTDDHVSGVLSTAGLTPNNVVGTDPQAAINPDTCEIPIPVYDSGILDIGDDQDPDGSAEDPGATGGPAADPNLWTDADGDGWVVLWDCDDDDPTTPPTWYIDSDNDGHGSPALTLKSCDQPAGYVASSDDCNDASPSQFPGAVWYLDSDGDTFGDASTETVQCAKPGPSWVADGTDCDDTQGSTNPAMDEFCSGVDNDCNSVIDDGEPQSTFYADADGDTYGDPSAPVSACLPPAGTTTNGSDCDDSNDAINPAATEVCNLLDDDCDGVVDDNPLPGVWYYDEDADGNGGPIYDGCDLTNKVQNSGDCDDDDPTVYPTAPEICDGKDNDCDGVIDDLDNTEVWYPDEDGDGYGSASGDFLEGCPPDAGAWARNDQDCDDADPQSRPDANDVVNDGVDQDCNGQDARAWILGGGGCSTAGDGGSVLTVLSRVLRRRP